MKPKYLFILLLALVGAQPTASYSLLAADLSITTSEVKVGGARTVTQAAQFGETVTKGALVYLNTDNSNTGLWIMTN